MELSKNQLEKIDDYFEKIRAKREDFVSCSSRVEEQLSEYLQSQDLHLLDNLIIYLEKGEGYLLLEIDASYHKLLRILKICQAESNYGQTPFCSGTANRGELLAKYDQAIYALRRILFQLSEDSVAEARAFLLELQPSFFCLLFLLQEQFGQEDRSFFDRVRELLAPLYTEEELRQNKK